MTAIPPLRPYGDPHNRQREPLGWRRRIRHRYYISRRLITGIDADIAKDQPHGQRIPAANLEALITNRMRSLSANPVEVLNAIAIGNHDAPAQRRMRDAAAALTAQWDRTPTNCCTN